MAQRSLGNRLKKRFLKTFFGYNRGQRYANLERLAKEIPARRILEIGTYRGSNALRMIRAAAERTPIAEVEYYGFDLFEWLDDQKLVAERSKAPPDLSSVRARLGASGAKVALFQGDTAVTLPREVPSLPPMDLIYIDGGHSLETIAGDWNNVQPLIDPHTVVVFDDYWQTERAGARPLIESLDRRRWAVRLLEPIDRSLEADGTIFVNRYAEVRPIKP